ncbi:MAG TPA: hypothetical protein PK050_12835 [Hyphomonadaceae bacterium]|nr:hypothetical protein [Hyphomonadaceae bacterium]
MRVIFGIFPLLAIPVIIYNMMALTSNGADVDGVSAMAISLADPKLGMAVFGSWRVTSGDILIILSMGFFFIEILKSTSTGSSTIANHAVSMLVFIVCLIEFLLLKNFQTSVFFILTVMTLLDVLAGVVVTIISARRDFTVGDGVPR